MLGLLFALLLNAPVQGRVLDAAGSPIAGASVTLVELRQQVTTRSDGAFAFDVPEGSYTIVARQLGYRTTSQRVTVLGSANVTVTLPTTALRVEPVTVTAARSAQDILTSTLPISVLTGERIHRDATMSLAKSIAGLPGVRDVSTGLQIGKPMVRGLFGPRVLVMHDGSRLEDYSWSEEDGPSIDARLAERVEVIRGPASVLYGSDALSGAVNVLPAELPVSQDGESFMHGFLETSAASNNIELGGNARVEGARGRMGWRLNGTGRFAGSYHAPDGEVAHTGFFSGNVDGAAAFRGSAHSATVRVSHYGGEFKLLEANGPTTPGLEEEGPERILLDDRLQVVGNHLFGKTRVETRAQLQRHALQEKGDECVPPPGQTTCTPPPPGEEAIVFDLLLNTATLEGLVHHSLGSRITGTVGASGMFQSSDSKGPIFLVPDASITSGAVFGIEELSFGKAKLSVAGRFDHRALSAAANAQLASADDDRSWDASIGHVGLVVTPTHSLALHGSVGMGWRAPTIFDLYANGPHLAENRYEIGDRTMDAERAVNADVGIRWFGQHAHADLSFFHNDIDDFIYLQPTGGTQNGLAVYQHVQSDARLSGAEALIEADVTSALTLRAQHDFVRGEHRPSGAPLPLMPPARTVVGGDVHTSRLTWAERVEIGAEVEHVAEQARRDPNDFATDAHTLLNLELEVDRRVRAREVHVNLDVHNATNTAYRDYLSRYKQFAQNAGTNVVLRVGADLF